MPPKGLTEATPKAVRQALADSRVEGDYLEFGVYQGATLLAAYKAAEEFGLSDLRLVGFDSFRGLPRPTGIDAGWKFCHGDYACDVETVWGHLDAERVPRERVTLVEGFYSRALTSKMQKRCRAVRVALIDCDLYASTVSVLDFLEPLLRPGSILLLDDWDAFDEDPERGERRALAEFDSRTSFSFVPTRDIADHGRVFVVT